MTHSKKIKVNCISLRERGYSLNKLVKTIKLPKTTIYDWIKTIPISQEVQEKFKENSRLAAIEANKARKGKCILGRSVIIPTKCSKKLIYLISHFMFDGCISHSGCEYYNSSLFQIRKMQQYMKEIFDLEAKVYNHKGRVKQIGYYYVELGDYISKVATDLPKYIQRASLQEKKVFLRSFFDDEGCVSIWRNIRRIKGYQHSLKILKLIQDLLADFGIESKIDRKYKEIVISRKENLIKFRNKINFSKGIYINPNRKNSIWKKRLSKREILDKAIGSYLS